MSNRIAHAGLAARRRTAQEAAALIQDGMAVGMSGFTGSGYPKAVPLARAERMTAAHAAGETFRVKVSTGASTAAECEGALGEANARGVRVQHHSDPNPREA